MMKSERTNNFASFFRKVYGNTSTRVLTLVFVFITIIAAYLVFNDYYTQLRLYQDKELSKMRSIANTLVLQIEGDELQYLFATYPNKDDIAENDQDSIYSSLRQVLEHGQEINMIETELYTMTYDKPSDCFLFGVSTSEPIFRHSYKEYPAALLDNYTEGGSLEPYKDENGNWLSAFAPIKNSKGEVVGILMVDERFDSFILSARKLIFKDILISLLVIGLIAILLTQAVRALLRKEELLKRKSEAIEVQKKELISNVSHDLRTPIAVIQGFAETMKMKGSSIDEDEFTHYMDVVLKNTHKLSRLVEELFTLSQLEEEGRTLKAESFPLSELAQDNSAKFAPIAEKKGIVLQTEIPQKLPLVYGELGLIDRVFQNLLDNALKFCDTGDTIRIVIEDQGDRASIEISDTGPGISKEDQETIFDRYHKKVQKSDTPSTGLGLAIVKRIMELHRSEIYLESDLGQGTTFRFEITYR